MSERMPQVGEPVVFHNPVGLPHQALVTAVWSKTLINVVYTSQDDAKTDPYGRQIERSTSVQHKSVMNVHGMYWRFPEESPNEITQPLAT